MNLATLPDRRAATAPHASAVADDALDPALHDGANPDADRIREHLTASLSKYKLPVAITVLSELPKNAIGKIDKSSLRKALATASARP